MAGRTCTFWMLVLAVHFVILFDKTTKGEDYLIAVPQKKQKGRTTIFVESGETGGQVQIQYPGLNWRDTHLLLDHGRYTEKIDNKIGTTFGIENNSIVVSGSDEEINVLVYENNYQSNIFSPLPVYALGQKYIVSSFHPPGHLSLLVLASHSQEAVVDIKINKLGNVVHNGRTYSGGDTLTLRLGEYQTFTVNSSSDLTGTVVHSTQTVALFCGMMTNIEVVAYTQLLPVKYYGQEYVVAVDDNPALYQLQIISEHRDTQIMFSDGSTASLDDSQLYRQTVGRNGSLYFTSTKPVMTTLYRRNGQHSIAVIPPVPYQTKLTRFYTHGGDRVVKVIATENSDVYSLNGDISWQKVKDTRFKVGTSFQRNTALMETNSSFTGTLLVYQSLSFYTTGLSIPREVTQTALEERESYLLAVTETSPCTVATTGVIDGTWRIRYPNHGQTHIRQFRPHSTDLFLTKAAYRVTKGIENKSISVTVIGRDTHVYSSNFLSQSSLVPVSALGTKYVVSHCLPPGDATSVLVIASHIHKTDVLITFKLDRNVIFNSRTFSDGDIFSVKLDKYQTFTLSSSSSLCGTVVESTQTVAVFSGTNPASLNSTLPSVTYSQLIPTTRYGLEFIITVDDPDTYLVGDSTRYYFQILSEQDDTQATFNNGLSFSLGQNRFYYQQLNHNETVYFRTSKPVLCTLCREREAKLTKAKAESCTVVPSTSLYVYTTTITNLDPFVNNLKIQTEQSARVKVMLSTGRSWIRPLPLSWENIKDTNYKVGTCRILISVPNDGSTLTVNVQSDIGFTVLGYGYSSVFNGGYRFNNNNVVNNTATTDTNKEIDTGPQINTGLIVGLTCGALVLILVVTGIILWKRKRVVDCWRKMTGRKDVMVTRNIAWSDLRSKTGKVTGVSLNTRQGMSTSA